MGVYLYFSVLILSLFLILNTFTAEADALEISNDGGDPCKDKDLCAVVAPYAKHLALTCTSEGKTLEWFRMSPLPDNNQTSVPQSSPDKPTEDVKLTAVKANERIKIYGSDKVVMNITTLLVEDEGRYFCQESASPTVKSADFELRVLPYVKSGKDLTVIEESHLNLTCAVLTSQPAIVSWNLTTQEFNMSSRWLNESDGRIELHSVNGTTNAELYIKSANITKDRGTYQCFAKNKWGPSRTNASVYVRVKSKYAALWPFLGMCAEVIILCSIIFIYEKKRDKTELEESDTDQGPETKSSPDHGQDSVRYRK